MTERRLSFGSWLRRRRKALDLTQAELATRSGCVLTTIKKIETGAHQPSRLLSREVGENGHSAQPLPIVRITFHHWLVSNVAASTALSPSSCGRNQWICPHWAQIQHVAEGLIQSKLKKVARAVFNCALRCQKQSYPQA